MSWVEELERVYELCMNNDYDGEKLLPVSHSTANAQITVNINSDGTIPISGFAEKVSKEDTVTIIPVTEKSAARSSGTAPHPFADKLVYIAGDYPTYATGKRADNSKYFEAYTTLLKSWCESPYSNKNIQAVYTYLSKKTLITDLIEAKILEIDNETGKLSNSKINGIEQQECFVRFKVDGKPTWKDQTMYDSFMQFNSMAECSAQLCYATGEQAVATYIHPSKIRNTGDKAKLFSTNDESGFSYRGRFSNKEEAVSIGYGFSQKLHNALKWLIKRQGKHIGDLCILTWESALQELPEILENSKNIFDDEDDEEFYDPILANRNQTYFSLTGRKNVYSSESRTMLMMFDSATTGRLSIVMYSELATSDYLENLEKWHNSTCWNRFGKIESFSMREISNFAFGTEKTFVECSPEVMKDTIQRLVPCAAEGRRVPADIAISLFNKACRPNSYEKENNWKNVLDCACAMLRRQIIEEKGECTMALDENRTSRDYLYGRLLAVADRAESSTYTRDEKRTTNARRFFEAFSNHPNTTWAVIFKNLRPYLDRMNEGSRVYYERLINEITDKFDLESFSDNSPLAPEFLHAYSCQTNAFYKNSTEDNEEEN